MSDSSSAFDNCSQDRSEPKTSSHLWNSFVAGAAAGLAVDVTLFPIDTIKTRLQSPAGFRASGGFSRLYLGIGSTISGSAPGAAAFFFTYETAKSVLPEQIFSFRYAIAAAAAETVACLIRVPVEVVKQRAQAYNTNSIRVLRSTIATSGFVGLYRGYLSTLYREIPFSLIQFPLWEFFKARWAAKQHIANVYPYQAMICGSAAGAIAAFSTTPLDVAKTHIMLQGYGQNVPRTAHNFLETIYSIYQISGIRGCFAGAAPRVAWIAVGGAIFLGGYEKVFSLLNSAQQ